MPATGAISDKERWVIRIDVEGERDQAEADRLAGALDRLVADSPTLRTRISLSRSRPLLTVKRPRCSSSRRPGSWPSTASRSGRSR